MSNKRSSHSLYSSARTFNDLCKQVAEARSSSVPSSPSILQTLNRFNPFQTISQIVTLGGKTPDGGFPISSLGSDGKWTQIHNDQSFDLNGGSMTSIGRKVYIANSGYNHDNEDPRAFMVFDVRGKSLRRLPDCSHLLAGSAMASLGNSIYLSGGKQSFRSTQDAFCFDTNRKVWRQISGMEKRRHGHVMVTGSDTVYAIGGSFGITTIEEYHPGIDRWHEADVRLLNSLDFLYQTLTAAFHDGAIYVCRPRSFHRVAPSAWIKEELPPPPNSRANSLVSHNGKLFSIGGCVNRVDRMWRKTAMVQEFDPRNEQWIRRGDMNMPRKRHSCVSVTY